jgi:hypothetical protein
VKKIHAPEKLKEACWGTFFEDLSIELVSSDLVIDDQQELYQIINASNSEKLLLENEIVNKLLKSYFKAGANFDLIEICCPKKRELFSLKIHNFLNVGYFIDIIIVEAYKNSFPCNEIRSFLNSLFTYLFQFLQTTKSIEPLEVSYGNSDEEFIVEISIAGKKLEIDKNLYRICNFLDVTEYTKKSNYTMSALWFKNDELKKVRYFFQRTQTALKLVNQNSSDIKPVFSAEAMLYDPTFKKGDIAKQLVQGSKEIGGQDTILVKGSPVDSTTGNIKVTSDKVYIQMEQQMLRMKDLLFKMKEQMKVQQINLDTARKATKSDLELLDEVAHLEIENLKLNDEKKYLNARLQLANRKLQIMDTNLDTREGLLRPNPEQEKEIEILKQQKDALEEKLSKVSGMQNLATQNLEFQKLTEIKSLYETKMKEQAAEIKKLDGRVKILATQLQGTLSKLSAPTTVGKTSDNHAKQLEHASNRVAEVTKEFNDKKKEVIMAKQENAKLLGKIYELEKKIQHYDKKAA